MNRLFLLDAYALIFRAYYALIKVPRLTQGGFNTSAIYGFVNTLEEILRKENPSHIAVCFDPSGPTFRNEAYKDYKADRSATPEDIKLSVPIIKEIIKAYNIPVIEVEGYEADDVIGTLAKRAEQTGKYVTYMMTPDKDYGQLVSAQILQYKPSYRGQDFELRGEEEVCNRYGIQRTSQIIDLLALMGDKIDNIPGCPGVGEKTAVKLINEYDSVEGIISHSSELKGALKRKIEENTEQIKFSKYLATICTDVPVDVSIDDLARKQEDKDKLFSIFKELEFKTLIERVGKRIQSNATDFAAEQLTGSSADAIVTQSEIDKLTTILVKDRDSLEELDKSLQGKNMCGLFLWEIGDNDVAAQWRATGICCEDDKSYYIPSSYKEGTDYILDLLARGDIEKVSINAKRDYVAAALKRNDNSDALVNYWDAAIAHYLLNPETRHGIEQLSLTYLGYEPEEEPKLKPFVKRNLFDEEEDHEDDTYSRWASIQAYLLYKLREPLEKAVKAEGMEKMLYEMELPLVRVLAEMELTGVRIDTKALKDAETDMEKRILSIQNEIYSLAGEEFNVGSPAKVGEILFDKLQLDPKAKRTKTGQYSTSEDILEKLSWKHPIISLILEYRSLRKLVSTYLSALPASINPATGKIHTNYNQTVTATGRLSSSSPNLQNIPVRDEEGRFIRRAFIADEGCLFMSADYSQIELRLLADFSGDEIMLDAFKEGKDIHAITAAKIYHKDQEDVTSDERRHAKTANFGIVYGISAFGLAGRLGIPRSDAKDIIDNYFATFPTVKHYMSQSVESAREHGYVETKLGRRRTLADINSKNPVVRGYAERNAINAPLQGTAADVIKIAMIRIYDEIKRRGLRSQMIMQVHDELNFNVYADEVAAMQEIVEREMEGAYEGKVKLTASCGVGANWLEAH